MFLKACKVKQGQNGLKINLKVKNEGSYSYILSKMATRNPISVEKPVMEEYL